MKLHLSLRTTRFLSTKKTKKEKSNPTTTKEKAFLVKNPFKLCIFVVFSILFYFFVLRSLFYFIMRALNYSRVSSQREQTKDTNQDEREREREKSSQLICHRLAEYYLGTGVHLKCDPIELDGSRNNQYLCHTALDGGF